MEPQTNDPVPAADQPQVATDAVPAETANTDTLSATDAPVATDGDSDTVPAS